MPLFSQSNSLILNSIEGTSHKFGAFRLFGSLGWAFIALVAGPVIGQIGIERLWIIYSVMMLISLAFAFTLPKGEAKGAAPAGKVNYRSMFVNRSFLLFLIIGLVISIPNSMNTTFIPLYIKELGGEASLIGWSAFWSSIFEIPVFLLLDRYLKKYKNDGIMPRCHQHPVRLALVPDVKRRHCSANYLYPSAALLNIWRLLLYWHAAGRTACAC